MKTVILSAAPREYYRETLVSGEELYCSPAVGVNTDRTWRSPTGDYDAPTFLKTLPAKWHEPDLLVVHFDVGLNCLPRNVGGVSGGRCPKVLMVGDTHHLAKPLRKFMTYAWSEAYDFVVGEFNRQHLHFFVEAQFGKVGWIPCFTLRPLEQFATFQRTRGATFVGQAGQYHPYRRWMLEEARRAGAEIGIFSGSQMDTARVHGESRISVNISLNGDFNLRTFEVVAAGGFLLTDRLSPESGIGQVFEEGKHYEGFGDVKELVAKIRHFSGRAEEALAQARAAHEHYLALHQPSKKIEALMALIGGKAVERLEVGLDARAGLAPESRERLMARAQVYEQVQEYQRTNPRVGVLYWPGAMRNVVDAIDLARVERSVVWDAGFEGSLVSRMGYGGRVKLVRKEEAGRRWGLSVCTVGDLGNPELLKFVERRGCDMLTVADIDLHAGDARADEALRVRGWRRWGAESLAYTWQE